MVVGSVELVLSRSEAFWVVNLHAKDGPCEIAYVSEDGEKSLVSAYYALKCNKRRSIRSKDSIREVCGENRFWSSENGQNVDF